MSPLLPGMVSTNPRPNPALTRQICFVQLVCTRSVIAKCGQCRRKHTSPGFRQQDYERSVAVICGDDMWTSCDSCGSYFSPFLILRCHAMTSTWQVRLGIWNALSLRGAKGRPFTDWISYDITIIPHDQILQKMNMMNFGSLSWWICQARPPEFADGRDGTVDGENVQLPPQDVPQSINQWTEWNLWVSLQL